MTQRKNDNLGYLGETYQYKLAHEFMENHTFFEDLSPILDQNMFTDPNLKTFVGVMKNYYEREGSVPKYDYMEIELRNIAHNDREAETYIAVLEKIKNTPSDGVDRTKALAERFFRQQNIIKTANEILKIAGNGDVDKYERCVELLNEAMTKGTHNDLGESVFDHINETLSDDYRIAIPTGIGKIDETLEGGLGKGELGVIVGSSSFGKTSMTTAIASHAATYRCSQNNDMGYKVLQIVFEDRIKQIQRKHIGRITGIEAKDLSKPGIVEQVKEQLETYEDKDTLKENLRIIRLPSGEKTADDIKRMIVKLKNAGFSPDLVIVDYFECLLCKGPSSDDNWEREGKTMRKFESMAGELNIAMWIPVQGTKDSLNAEIVTMDKAGGSFKKIQIAHIVMSIARSVDDIAENKATIAILKNRAGKSGKVLNNVYFNNGTCTINTDNVDELDSMLEARNRQDEAKLKTQADIFNRVKNEQNSH